MKVRGVMLAAAVLITGCGGDDDADEAVPETLPVDPAYAPFCDAFGLLLVNPLTEPAAAAGGSEALQAAVEAAGAIVQNLRETAPAAVAPAVEAVATEYAEVFAVLARYGYDLARLEAEATPEDRLVLDSFGSPAVGPGVTDPQAELEAFVAQECAPGVTLPPDLAPTTTNP